MESRTETNSYGDLCMGKERKSAKSVGIVHTFCPHCRSLVDRRTRGLSRFSDQGEIVAMLGGREGRPNPFCKCTIVGLRTAFYIVMCDTLPLRGELTVLG